MPKYIPSLTGCVVGNLIIVDQYMILNQKYNRNETWFKCRCHCGRIFETRGTGIVNGKVTGCGCHIRHINILPIGEAAFNKLFYSYKNNAKKRNYNFQLTKEEFQNLTKRNCYYCGKLPTKEYNGKYKNSRFHFNGSYFYNGIDRVDSNQGYTLDNCVPCCTICNHAKMSLTLEQFENYFEQLTYYRIFKNCSPLQQIKKFLPEEYEDIMRVYKECQQ